MPGPRERFVAESAPAVGICHPDWRGILSATLAQGLPVITCDDLALGAPRILDDLGAVGAAVVIVNGFPPGTDVLARAASAAGLVVRVVMHSSMAQHGAEPNEAEVVDRLLALADAGVVDVVGFTKDGQPDAFAAMGYRVVRVLARTSRLEPAAPRDLGAGTHLGLFAEASWRKNVATQIGAAAILGATAHVTVAPRVGYLSRASVTVHGLLPREDFLALMASVDANLCVSLYESFPVTVQESFYLGAPALMSRTSSLFRDDQDLWSLCSVEEHDNPAAIARGADRLLAQDRSDVVSRGRAWLEAWDERAARAWTRFTSPEPYGADELGS